MAFETITNVAGTYSETIKPVVKVDTKQAVTQVQTVSIPVVDTSGHAKSLSGETHSSDQEEAKKRGVQASEQQMKAAASEVTHKLKGKRTGCEFTYHEETNRVSIRVFDKETNEVIREIPPEEAVEMLENIWEIAGLLIDERR